MAVWVEEEGPEFVTDKLALALGCLTYGGEEGAFQHTHFSRHCITRIITFLQLCLIAGAGGRRGGRRAYLLAF